MIGHIKLDRKILDWEWYKDINVAHLFIYLILKANFKDGKWRGFPVKRGQLITGRLRISADTGLSERQIRTCLNKLKTTNEIIVETTNQYSVITICKYDVYQSKKDSEDQQVDQQQVNPKTNERPTSDQRATTIEEEVIKKKNEIGVEPEFIFKLKSIYDKSWEQYSAILNGQAKCLNEKKFNDWKHFVDFVNEKGFTNLYEARFVTPIEFDKIVSSGFTKNKWEKVLKAILATGVKPEHNLFFRIPQFMNYLKTESGKPVQPIISL